MVNTVVICVFKLFYDHESVDSRLGQNEPRAGTQAACAPVPAPRQHAG